MDLFGADQVSGGRVVLKTTDPRHIAGSSLRGPQNDASGSSFQDMMFEALNGVNKLQQESDSLSLKMVVDPDSVDPHDITIAMAKANTALALTKAVIDRSVRAYKDILSVR